MIASLGNDDGISNKGYIFAYLKVRVELLRLLSVAKNHYFDDVTTIIFGDFIF